MKDSVVQCIYAAIDEANRDRPGKPPIEKSPQTAIHGTASDLDSLGLINFVVTLEENLEQSLGVSLVLADDRALSQEPSPFRSVADLAAYIEVLMNEAA